MLTLLIFLSYFNYLTLNSNSQTEKQSRGSWVLGPTPLRTGQFLKKMMYHRVKGLYVARPQLNDTAEGI
jgi:hypothetical protein